MSATRLGPLLALLTVFLACGPAATSTPAATKAAPTSAATSTAPAPATSAPAATSAPTARAGGTPTAVKASPKYGGNLTMAFWLPIPTWDVFSTSTLRSHIPVSFVYDRLFVFKAQPGCTLEAEPSLAKTWKWVNDTTLEIALQPGARFANRPPVNGREITADDIVYSFTVQAARQPGYAPFYNYAIQRVEAVDKGTVRFVLKMPNAFFIERAFTRFTHIVAKEAFDASGKITEARMNVGSGPYILEKDVPSVSVSYVRNPDFHQKALPYPDSLQLKIIQDFGTQMALLRTGNLDYTFWQAQHPLIDEAKRTLKDYQVQTCFHANPPVLGMVNTSKPFDDVRVRQAISMAIDRQGLIKSAYLGMSQVIGTAIAPAYGYMYLPPEQMPSEARRYLEYNPQEAKRLLAAAGYPDGIKFRFWSTPEYGRVFTAITESLVDSFKAAGMQAEIYSPEYTKFQSDFTSGKFDGVGLGWYFGPSFHELVFDGFHSAGRGGISYKQQPSPRDDLVDRLMSSFDQEAQKKLARELQIYAVQNPATIAMPPVVDAGVAGKWVKGVNFIPTWDMWEDHLRNAWIDR